MSNNTHYVLTRGSGCHPTVWKRGNQPWHQCRKQLGRSLWQACSRQERGRETVNQPTNNHIWAEGAATHHQQHVCAVSHKCLHNSVSWPRWQSMTSRSTSAVSHREVQCNARAAVRPTSCIHRAAAHLHCVLLLWKSPVSSQQGSAGLQNCGDCSDKYKTCSRD